MILTRSFFQLAMCLFLHMKLLLTYIHQMSWANLTLITCNPVLTHTQHQLMNFKPIKTTKSILGMCKHAFSYYWLTLKFNAICSTLSFFNKSNKIFFYFKHYDSQKLNGCNFFSKGDLKDYGYVIQWKFLMIPNSAFYFFWVKLYFYWTIMQLNAQATIFTAEYYGHACSHGYNECTATWSSAFGANRLW